VTRLRCAIYARYSTDKQSPLSINDQIRKCCEFAQSQDWEIAEDQVYSDEAITGATDGRFGLRRLLEAATSGAKPFQVVLVDDTSRLSRKLSDSLRIFEQLRFADVRLCFVSQGIDTESEQAEVLLATHGIVDSLYIRELAKKTHRGVEGKALQGFHTGGRCFGYRSVLIEDQNRAGGYGRPKIVGVKLERHPEQAEVVKRIFADYAAGHSITTIAKSLNAESVPSPAPYRGQRHPSWAPAAISVMLHNERYRGVTIWNRTKKIRDPRTGRRIQRVRPRSDWTVVESPHLRIISEEVWEQVQSRLATVNSAFSNGHAAGLASRSYGAKYLFSGFMKCGVCGSNIVLISGRGGAGWAKYGCPLHHNRGLCRNDLVVRRDALEQELISGLQREVLQEDVVAFAIEEFNRQLHARLESTRSQLGALRSRREKLKSEIANLANAIAQGHASATLIAELAKREKELDGISEQLLATNGSGLDAKLHEMQQFVHKRLQDIRSLLFADVPRAKAELSKHCKAITLTPADSGYRISGEWDLLGGRSVNALPPAPSLKVN
jgi:site-specific DNA recombinase